MSRLNKKLFSFFEAQIEYASQKSVPLPLSECVDTIAQLSQAKAAK
ncbi:MAG: hypothetical protein WBD50_06945 [Candidatus Rhabdochlamydia sp.]